MRETSSNPKMSRLGALRSKLPQADKSSGFR